MLEHASRLQSAAPPFFPFYLKVTVSVYEDRGPLGSSSGALHVQGEQFVLIYRRWRMPITVVFPHELLSRTRANHALGPKCGRRGCRLFGEFPGAQA